jgi:YHS domain-containing protein
MGYPKVTVKRGARFVDEGRIATSAGLSAGIDLALHIVARYYGMQGAHNTAYYMEYQGTGWTSASNVAYAKPPVPRVGGAICPVCWMDVSPKTALQSSYKSKSYYFCSSSCKQRFDASPAAFLVA